MVENFNNVSSSTWLEIKYSHEDQSSYLAQAKAEWPKAWQDHVCSIKDKDLSDLHSFMTYSSS